MKNLALLLQKVKTDGQAGRLLHEGLSYKEITVLIDRAIENNFLIFINGKISLTEAGEEYLEENLSSIKNRNKETWIDTENSSKISKIEIDSIFLPDKNNLSF